MLTQTRRAFTGGAVLVWLVLSSTVGYSFHAAIVVNRTDDPNPAGLACAGLANDCSLRAAVIKGNTSPGPDTITLPAGTYTLTIASTDDDYNFAGAVATTGDLDIFDNDGDGAQVSDLTITGAGSGVTIIQAAPDAVATPIDRIFDVENVYGSPSAEGLNFTLSGVTLRYGRARTLTTADGPFLEVGGAINFDGCHFTGVACTSRGVLTMTDVIVTNNQAPGPGGGVYAQNVGGIALTDVRILNNTSTISSGGGLFHLGGLGDGSISIVAGGLAASTVSGNSALGSGGGIRLGAIGSSSTVAITSTNFTNNTSGAGTVFGGGALAVESGKAVTITGGSFVTNTAAANGGAIYFDALGNDLLTLSRVDLRNNTADFGNDGSGDGGAIYDADGEVRLISSIVRDNIAVNGAGIAAGPAFGSPNLTLRNATLTGNLAKTLGGAVFFDNAASSATLTNVTMTANRANTSNAAGTAFGGGLARANGSVVIQNTIIAGNFTGSSGTTADDGKSSASTTANFSLIQTTTNFTFTGGSNITGSSPTLGPLQDNGGGLPTFALLIDSPALDAGSNTLATNASLTTDQRGTGFTRILDSADANTTATVDIGAYEAAPTIENIGDITVNEDTVASVTFNVGDAIQGVSTGVASFNWAVIDQAGLVITGQPAASRTLTMTPVSNAFGVATIRVALSNPIGTQTADTFVLTVLPVADLPAITNASSNEDTQTTLGLVTTRNVVDGAEVTHFKITGITNGTLFKNDGTSSIPLNGFITFAEANAGLKFTPAANKNSASDTFSVAIAGATSAGGAGLGPSATATIAVASIADAPTITATTTNEDTQSATGLVIDRNAVDGIDVTHFKVTGITGGTLFKNDGTTAISNGQFITYAESNAGLKFTPTADLSSPGTTFGFTVAGATAADGSGLGAGTAASITVTPIADAPTISAATTNEDTLSATGLVIVRNAADGAEITHFKITGITNGTLFQNNGTTGINNNDFITAAEGNAGLRFTPAANAFSPGTTFTFSAAGATDASGAGLGPGTAASISVTPIADAPTISGATTTEDTQSSSGLVLGRNAADSTEVTHFKITGITGGTLFKNDGTTAVNDSDVITFAEGAAGLRFTPAANAYTPASSFSFTAAGATSGGGAGLGAGTVASITVTPAANAPSMTAATTTEDAQSSAGLVISRNAADGVEVTHFKITGITNGTLFQNNGTTPINTNDFITFAEGNAGLKFTPAANASSPGSLFGFTAAAATDGAGAGLSSGTAASITVTAVADAPGITPATTTEDAQTSSGLVISRNAADSTEVTHFKITGITNGLLFKSDGAAPINNNDIITFAEANAGLKFTPNVNLNSLTSTFGFTVAGATSAGGAGLGVGTVVSITVTSVADAPTISAATTNEDIQSASGLVIAPNAADSTDVTHFKITAITGGALFKNDGATPINNNDVITVAEGAAGLKFTPAANLCSPASTFALTAAGATSAAGAGLGPATSVAITVTTIADTPAITNASTTKNVQTTSGLVISRNAVDGAEVTHFKITGIVNGTLFKNDGATPINVNDVITFAEGNVGLKFTPASGKVSPGDTFSVSVQGATSAGGTGLSPTATATITVLEGPVITTQPQDQQIQTGHTGTMTVAASGPALSYQWYIGASGTTTNAIGGATSPSYTTATLTQTTAYWVRVSNTSGSADSRTATVHVTSYQPFTDSTLVAGVTPLRAVHITELRDRINAQRQRFGLGVFAWSNATLTADASSITAIDIAELRTALLAAYRLAGGAQPAPFTDPSLAVGSTSIKRIHIQELRDAVIALEAR